MKRSRDLQRAGFRLSALLLVSLYAIEISACLIALAFYKKGERPFLAFATTPAGLVLGVSVIALAVAALAAGALVRSGCLRGKQRVGAVLAYNLWSVALSVVTAEVIIRTFTVNLLAGPSFANTLLLPRSWERTVAFNKAALAWAAANDSYLVSDPELGWTIGPSRRSRDYNQAAVESRFQQPPHPISEGSETNDEVSYLSSVEGLRSAQRGIALIGERASRRIAILGDSFTFGLYVEYEQTWGHQLESLLGNGAQVLNFGVDGYGVDQAYLRYEKDATRWHPDVVILGAINDDLRRTMCVYAFLCFERAKMPFAKPRFVLKEQQLELENMPLPDPETIFEAASISEVPFVADDPSYGQRSDWEEHLYHRLYLARFLISRFPRWPLPNPAISEEAERSINGEIFRAFVKNVRAHGSVPILVYFSSAKDYQAPGSPGTNSVVGEVLDAFDLPYINLKDCVGSVSPEKRFHHLHYTAEANAAVARCLADPVRAALDRMPSTERHQ